MAERLAALQVDPKILQSSKSYPEVNPVDIYTLLRVCTSGKIPGRGYGDDLSGFAGDSNPRQDRGDLNLAVPSLRVKSQDQCYW